MSSFQVSPSTISNECMCLGLRRAARAVSRRFDEALRPLDLNNGQFSMLTVIAGMQPVGIQALADHLAMDRTTVTAALKPLQRRGLVEADVSETDSRGRDARLTAAGNTLVTDAIPIWQSFQAQLNGGLAPSEVAHMREFLALLS